MDKEIRLKKIFKKIFPHMASSFDLNMPRSEFENWDSLTHMQLISEIEEEFLINFEMDDIIDIQKPSDFIKQLNKKSV